MPRYCLPCHDVIFQRLFAETQNRDLLVSLLTAVLAPSTPIATARLLPTDQQGDTVHDKLTRLDVRVELVDGREVDVEMQNARRVAQRRRALLYWARMYGTQLRRGEGYDQLRPCAVIRLLGYPELPGDRFHSVFRVREIHDHTDFSEVLELHVVELPKLGSAAAGSKLEAWGRFLGARSRAELEQAMKRDPELQKAWEEVERLNQDPATRALAWERETALMAYEAEMAEALSQGKARGKAEAVLEALEAGGLEVTEADRARILACQSVEELRTWLRRAVTVERVADVFEA